MLLCFIVTLQNDLSMPLSLLSFFSTFLLLSNISLLHFIEKILCGTNILYRWCKRFVKHIFSRRIFKVAGCFSDGFALVMNEISVQGWSWQKPAIKFALASTSQTLFFFLRIMFLKLQLSKEARYLWISKLLVKYFRDLSEFSTNGIFWD